MPLLRLTAIPIRSIKNVLPEDCARACVLETSFECKSFDIEFTTKTCRLQNHSHEEPFFTLQVSTSVDHYRPNYERLFQRIPNHILTFDHQRKIPGVTVEQCARRCIVETAFKCMGFDFESKLQNCWLTKKTTQSEGIMKQSGSDFYERKTEGPMENFFNFGYGRMQQIEGEHVYNKIVIGVTQQACAQLCLAETAFRCHSFDFVFEDNSCHMSQYMAANVYGLDISVKDENKVIHFEVKDEYLSKFYATPYTAVLGHNERTYHKVTPSSCARRCLHERTFVCRSFDYQTHEGTCLLSSKTGSDVGGLTKQGFGQIHHFEMKPFLDCGGLLEGESGGFASPNWPRRYPHNMNCSWTIVVPKFKIIVLKFIHFDLGSGNSEPCKSDTDYIFVSEWTSNNQSKTCLTKGNNEYTSYTNNLTLTFISNLKNDSQGFRVFYRSDWPCGGTLTNNNGQLSSPNWPGSYPASASCIWKILAPKGAKIQVNFVSLDLEQHMSGNCISAYDYVYIFENKNISNFERTFCGYSKGEDITSTGNDLYISFRSDERVQRSGFHAIYRFLLPETTSLQTTEFVQQTTKLPPVSIEIDRNQSKEIHMTLRAMFIENRRQNPKSNNLLRHDSNENRTTTFPSYDKGTCMRGLH
ncbi:hypothetical protein FSP39_009442 [Pinctada imbricata]|uniref:Uncharacterized protein n=1 Tax=Pinctada imbricata TaxID=66713 RepID=A0AA88XSC6_PINIB|nr:hypothetical protein FSP39_009442 [Pinctada imbricata]